PRRPAPPAAPPKAWPAPPARQRVGRSPPPLHRPDTIRSSAGPSAHAPPAPRPSPAPIAPSAAAIARAAAGARPPAAPADTAPANLPRRPRPPTRSPTSVPAAPSPPRRRLLPALCGMARRDWYKASVNTVLGGTDWSYTLPLDAFVRSVGINRGVRHALLLGAGASVTSGMPSAETCVWQWKRDIVVTNNPGLERQLEDASLPSVRTR